MCLRKLDIVKLCLTTETTLIWSSPYIPLYDLKSFVFFYRCVRVNPPRGFVVIELLYIFTYV